VLEPLQRFSVPLETAEAVLGLPCAIHPAEAGC